MEIGLFQLESITSSPTAFVFFDLRTERSPLHPEIDRCLRRAEASAPERVSARLEELGAPNSLPILLLDARGDVAAELSDQLRRKGFDQVYPVDGGAEGLVRELNES